MMSSKMTPFEGLPPNALGHFRLFFYAAILSITNHLRRLSELTGQSLASLQRPFPFLETYEVELRACVPGGVEGSDALRWWREQTELWEQRTTTRLPLRALAQNLELTRQELIALMLVGVVEEDIRFGSLFAALQEPLTARRPCLGLVAALASVEEKGGGLKDWWLVVQRLVQAGLVVAENQAAPRAEWVLRVPNVLWDVIRGRATANISYECKIISRREFPPLKKLALDAKLHEKLARLPAVLAGGQLDAVVVRGMAESGRRTVLGSLARSLRRDLLFCDYRIPRSSTDEVGQMIGPLATLTGALPVIVVDPAPGETVELPPLKDYRGPAGIIMRPEGGVRGEIVEHALTVTLPPPAPDHRESIWRTTLGERVGPDLDTIVNRFLLPLGNVHRAARIATTYALLERRDSVTTADVQQACRSLNRQKLDTLAQRLTVSGSWNDLVLNEGTTQELLELECRCRQRERLLENLGAAFRNSMNRGVRALFNGPSGTGKTLAAKILAAVLQTDVYRVDLASVVNKYIGETEKNLSQLLARAEELDVILLIDEGDALMTNRTDVKSANDRYANLETNYLLQRLETYQGIVIVTTNAGNRIDAAFQRRFDIIIDFQPPDPYERLLMWQHHLPSRHNVNPACLQEIAHHCALIGGQIRNAALYASLLAVDAGRDGEISDADLSAAVQREYRKAGASYPLQEPAIGNAHNGALDKFLADLN
jgi:AAA+ superfamily predicted ATPase